RPEEDPRPHQLEGHVRLQPEPERVADGLEAVQRALAGRPGAGPNQRWRGTHRSILSVPEPTHVDAPSIMTIDGSFGILSPDEALPSRTFPASTARRSSRDRPGGAFKSRGWQGGRT